MPSIRLSWPVLRALAILLVLGLIAGHAASSQHAAAEIANQKAAADARASLQESTFASQIRPLLNDDERVTSSIAEALPGRQVRQYGSDESFDGASTAKLLTAADLLHKADTGKLDLNQTIAGTKAADLLEQMIIDSDDTAWTALNDYLGHDDLATYAQSIGFTDYDPATNTFPASSVAKLLQSLYGGQLLKPANRALLLGYLQHANHREFMVSGVLPGITTYHKIGMDEDNIHDAMIIEKNGHWAVVVVFTNGHGSFDWNDRALLMQQIAADASETLL